MLRLLSYNKKGVKLFLHTFLISFLYSVGKVRGLREFFTGIGVGVIRFVVGLCVVLLSCGADVSDVGGVEKILGSKIAHALRQAGEAETFHVSQGIDEAEEFLGPYAIVDGGVYLSDKNLVKLQSTLLNEKNFRTDVRRKCAFRPELAIRFDTNLIVFMSLSCPKWAFSYKEQWVLVDVGLSQSDLSILYGEIYSK